MRSVLLIGCCHCDRYEWIHQGSPFHKIRLTVPFGPGLILSPKELAEAERNIFFLLGDAKDEVGEGTRELVFEVYDVLDGDSNLADRYRGREEAFSIGDLPYGVEETFELAIRTGRLRVEKLRDPLFDIPVPVEPLEPKRPPRPPPPPEPPTQSHTFTVRLVDEIGVPISNAKVSIAHGSESDDVKTGGDGKASIEDESAYCATATFSDVDALKKAVRPRWNTVRKDKVLTASAHLSVVYLRGDQLPEVDLQAGVIHTVSVQPYVERVRILGGGFDTSKCFLLPWCLDGVRSIVLRYEDNQGAALLIVGHTDTAGSADYNDKLSIERARSLKDYLTDNVDGWLAWYDNAVPIEKRWGSIEDGDMINALPDASTRPSSADPVKWYQATRGLKVDGIAGPVTRRTLVGEYMALDGTTLPASITPMVHGCGENFQADTTADGVANPDNRRVEVFFFDGILGVQPPASGSNSQPGSREYPEWVKRSKVTKDHKVPLAATGIFVGGSDVVPSSSEATPAGDVDEATPDEKDAQGDWNDD